MLMVVDYSPSDVRIWSFRQARGGRCPVLFVKKSDEIQDDKSLKGYINSIAGRNKIDAISFRVLFGGDYFAGPTFIGARFFSRFAKLIDLFPFYVPLTLEMLKKFQRVFPGIPLIAFFETSFFLRLPDEEKYYALPFEYYRNSKIKKWGFHGIFHEANAGYFPAKDKTISVVFDKQTTICAICDKRPLSISLGYTPLEGVMSRTACGALDPGIVFYLMNVHNFSIYEIDEMLKKESGFKGLTGYDMELNDMLKLNGKDDKVSLAFDVFRSQILKHIGDGISVMGGLNNMVFSGNCAKAFSPIIYSTLKKLSFLGINVLHLPWDSNKNFNGITSGESKIQAYLNKTGLAEIILQKSRHMKYSGKREKAPKA